MMTNPEQINSETRGNQPDDQPAADPPEPLGSSDADDQKHGNQHWYDSPNSIDTEESGGDQPSPETV